MEDSTGGLHTPQQQNWIPHEKKIEVEDKITLILSNMVWGDIYK